MNKTAEQLELLLDSNCGNIEDLKYFARSLIIQLKQEDKRNKIRTERNVEFSKGLLV